MLSTMRMRLAASVFLCAEGIGFSQTVVGEKYNLICESWRDPDYFNQQGWKNEFKYDLQTLCNETG